MYKSAKQYILEHILKGTTNAVVYIKKMRCLLPATMERDLHSGNGLEIYVNYHRSHRSLKNTISLWIKYCTFFKAYQDLS